jgi:hypothetical protein
MRGSKLPDRASLEYLKKLAKDRLQELRRADPRAKLASMSRTLPGPSTGMRRSGSPKSRDTTTMAW